MRDCGSMSLVVVMTGVAVVAAVTFALVPLLVGLTHRQQAQSAADAAALAGVTGGRAGAASLAASNGAALVSYSRAGRAVTVHVRVGDQVVIARATDEP